MYGYWQYFRPQPGLPNQVYRFNPETGALTVVADGFVAPNGRLSTRTFVKRCLCGY
jgi:gluconolactonase